MMTPEQLEKANATLTQVIAALRGDSVALVAQYLALSQTVDGVIADRDALKKKVAELEAFNKKLTDQLWGRRSERRLDSSATPLLNFGDDLQSLLKATTEVLGPEVIAAQAAVHYCARKRSEVFAQKVDNRDLCHYSAQGCPNYDS